MRKLIFSARKKDFRFDTFCTGGKGGQHQNRNATGVRYTHLGTGLAAESREFKSHVQNKKAAFGRLADRLVQWVKTSLVNDPQRSTEVIRTYNAQRGTVKDHRTGQQGPYTVVLDGGFSW